MSAAGDISVVITTTGRATLGRALLSAINQTEPPLEVIVVDDRAEEIVRPLNGVMTSACVRVVRTGGRGANTARNLGISEARGRVVALLDDDDIWFPDKLAVQRKALDDAQQPSSTLVTCRAFVESAGSCYPKRPLRGASVADYLFSRRLRSPFYNGFFQTSGFLFERDLGLAFPFDSTLRSHQDWDWLLRLESAGVALFQVDRVLYFYSAPQKTGITATASLIREHDWALRSLPPRSSAMFGYFWTFAAPRAVALRDYRAAARALGLGCRYGQPGLASALMGVGYALTAVAQRSDTSATATAH